MVGGLVKVKRKTCNACRVESSIGLWVAGFFSSRNIVAILLFHWESWLGFGMIVNPGKRKTRRFALGKFICCCKRKKKKDKKKKLSNKQLIND